MQPSYLTIDSCRDRVDRPFPCLDVHYRRELVRVYLKEVEPIFLSFMKEKRSKLMEDKTRWERYKSFHVC